MKRLHYQEGKFALGNILCAVVPYCPELVSARYLYEYLTAYKDDLLVTKMLGTANVSLTISKIAEVPVPLITPKSQQRLDELMALCDDLEVSRSKRERRRDRLVSATLHGLNNGNSDSEASERLPFEDSARFYFNYLPSLTTRPEHIQQLRQTILNLAVRGKLVPQDPKDEPEKAVQSLDVPFHLPSSWRWKSVSALGKTQTGSTPPTGESHHFNGNIPFIKPAAINDGVINYKGEGLTESGVKESRLVQAGAILMVCIGGSIGKAAVADRQVCFNQQINSLSLYEGTDSDYILIAMQSPYFKSRVVDTAAQGTLPIISKGKWERLLIPIPPLAEQHRIVAKVDDLMKLCDEMEARITTNTTTSRKLLEATLQESIS